MADKVAVRMYDVGFGDAFLVTLPTSGGTRRILFDCGTIAQGPKPIKEVAADIIKDCTGNDGIARIDVVVGTHRHKDHVSGFASGDWDNVVVGEVWLPWTEHPTDQTARRIREVQSGLSLALAKSPSFSNLDLLGLAERPDGPDQVLDPIAELALNALSNDAAMKTLHSGFSGSPQRRFLPRPFEKSFTTNVLPGVTIHVLGPSRDEDVIRDMDPPHGKNYLRMTEDFQRMKEDYQRMKEVYLRIKGDPMRMKEEAVTLRDLLPNPFSDEFEIAPGSVPPSFMGVFDASEQPAIGRGTDLSEFDVAVALDKAINGTSLMLVLEIRGTHLLFPGDAQWGTWNAALSDPEFRALLRKTRFYKIGHHGSHNATPKDFVENAIPDSIIAMASTKERPIWPNIPRMPLLDALAAKHAKVARSDKENNVDNQVFNVKHGSYIETHIPL